MVRGLTWFWHTIKSFSYQVVYAVDFTIKMHCTIIIRTATSKSSLTASCLFVFANDTAISKTPNR